MKCKRWEERWVLHPGAGDDFTYIKDRNGPAADLAPGLSPMWYKKWTTQDFIAA